VVVFDKNGIGEPLPIGERKPDTFGGIDYLDYSHLPNYHRYTRAELTHTPLFFER
jgi:hypothetical protein